MTARSDHPAGHRDAAGVRCGGYLGRVSSRAERRGSRIDPRRRRRAATRIACEVSGGRIGDGTFNPDEWMDPKDQRKVDDFIVHGMAAARQAARRRGLEARSYDDAGRDRRA